MIQCLKALIEACDGVWDDESDEFTIELDLVRRHGYSSTGVFIVATGRPSRT